MAVNLLKPAKNRVILWRQLILQTFKNFTSFQRIFQRPFMRKILLILYGSCPLTSQIRVRTVSSSDDCERKILEI